MESLIITETGNTTAFLAALKRSLHHQGGFENSFICSCRENYQHLLDIYGDIKVVVLCESPKFSGHDIRGVARVTEDQGIPAYVIAAADADEKNIPALVNEISYTASGGNPARAHIHGFPGPGEP